QIGRLFGDHYHWCIDVAADEIRHRRSIDDAQCVDPQYFEFGIDDGRWIAGPPHLASAKRVVNGDARRPDMRVDLGIGPARGTGRDLPGIELRQSGLIADLAYQPEAGAQCRPVLVGCEKILPDTRRHVRVGRSQFNTSAAFRPKYDGAAGKTVGVGRYKWREIG